MTVTHEEVSSFVSGLASQRVDRNVARLRAGSLIAEIDPHDNDRQQKITRINAAVQANIQAASRDNKIAFITIAIWIWGAIPIYLLWNFHFKNEFLDSVWGLAIYLVAFSYFIVLVPIHRALRDILPPPPLDELLRNARRTRP